MKRPSGYTPHGFPLSRGSRAADLPVSDLTNMMTVSRVPTKTVGETDLLEHFSK